MTASNPYDLSRYQVKIPGAITDLATNPEYAPLPDNYQPTDYDIVCGRGKGSYNKPGNRRFRAMVKAHIGDYLLARSRLDKSAVLSTIMDRVRSQNDGQVRFVSLDENGQWMEISDEQAREKVGHTMREALTTMEAKEAQRLQPVAREAKPETQDHILEEKRAALDRLLESMVNGSRKKSHFHDALSRIQP